MYKDLEHYQWYWLRLNGPDGKKWQLARYENVAGHATFMCPFDGCVTHACDFNRMLPRLHKWDVLDIEKAEEPRYEP